MEGAAYASITLAIVIVFVYVLYAWCGPIGRVLAFIVLTPVVLILLGMATGLVIGFAAGSSMPWVKRFRAQQQGTTAADPYETALALAGKLPQTRRIAFMYALRDAWGIEQACADMAQEFMARTGRVQ